jgi:hypothetical protein
MDKIFQYSTKISTPLGLAGFCIAILCYLYLERVKKKDAGTRTLNTDNSVIFVVLKYIYRIAMVATVIGVSGFAFKQVYPLINSKGQRTQRFSIYMDNRPIQGINVTADNVEASGESNRDGIVSLTFNELPGVDSLHLLFKSEQYNLDTVKTEPLNKFPASFKFASTKVVKSVRSGNANTSKNSIGKSQPNEIATKPVLLPKAAEPVADGSENSFVQSITFSTHTNDDDKDRDTWLNLEIKSANFSQNIAGASYLANNILFPDHSDNSLNIPFGNSMLTKGQCAKFNVKITQYTNGNDTWKFNCTVTMKFGDGSQITATQNNIVLKNYGATVSFAAQ